MTSRGSSEVSMETEREKPAWEARKLSPSLVVAWICGQEVEESQVLRFSKIPPEASGKLVPQPTGESRRA